MSGKEISPSAQLWELSVEQAQEVLNAFLATERGVFSALNRIGAVELDYTRQSVEDALHHLASEVKAGRLDGEQRSLWFSRLGYYFGEALRRQRPSLSWGLGDPQYAFANHPSIKGFAGDEEAALITITKNIVLAVAIDGAADARIANAVQFWFDLPAANTP